MNTATVLIVEDDHALLEMLRSEARRRGYGVLSAATLPAARRLIGDGGFEVALSISRSAPNPASTRFAIRQQARDTELSSSRPARRWRPRSRLQARCLCLRPEAIRPRHAVRDGGARIEHRAVVLSNRRLVWEQQLINEVGEELRHLLAPEQLVERVLLRLMRGMSIDASLARLLNPETGAYDLSVINAPEEMRREWATFVPPSGRARAIACSPPARRFASPIFARGSTLRPPRDAAAVRDERADVRRRRPDRRAHGWPARRWAASAATTSGSVGVIANQAAVGDAERAAARLHPRRQAGVGSDVRRDQRSDRRLRSPGPAAARQRGAGGLHGAAGHGAARARVRRGRSLRRQFPACAVGHAAGSSCIARRGDAPGRPDLQRHDVAGPACRGRRRDRADRARTSRSRSRPRAACAR